MTPQDPMVVALWQRVLENFESDAVHAAFLEGCRERGRLADAAFYYRSQVEMPGRRERAEKQLETIVTLAFSALTVREREVTTRRNRHLVGLLLFALLGASLCAIYWLR
jgi:hypothetical protein